MDRLIDLDLFQILEGGFLTDSDTVYFYDSFFQLFHFAILLLFPLSVTELSFVGIYCSTTHSLYTSKKWMTNPYPCVTMLSRFSPNMIH